MLINLFQMKNNVSVILVNYNKSVMTFECVKSILRSEKINFQITIVDNGSENKELEILKELFIKESHVEIIETGKNLGYAGGVNVGIMGAKKKNSDYVLIMNNDTLIDRKAIYELITVSNMYCDKCIVSGKVYDFEKKDVLQYIGSYFTDLRYLKEVYPGKNQRDVGQYDKIEERDMIDDIFWLLPLNVVNDVGLYSTCFFMYSEQADYALRAKKKGYKLLFCPKAMIWHKGSLSTGGRENPSPAAIYWRYKSSIKYLFLHIQKRFFFIHTIKKLFKNIFLLLANFFHKTNRTLYLASLLGIIHALWWIFHKKDDTNYNPFLK
jgi:GT2 family glycosyltransferase